MPNSLLDIKVKLLNTVTDSALEPYSKTENGYKVNVGNFSVEHVNGYYNLIQVVNHPDGQRHLTSGTRNARVQFIDAYIQGYQEAKHETDSSNF
jgi:hypothetical protein